MVDIYHQRRGMFRRCKYWKRDESKKSVLEYNDTPKGTFWAKEEASLQNQENTSSNVFHFDRNVITIKTNDEVADLEHGDIVEYRRDKWFVDSVSFGLHTKETEFSNKIHATAYINLRK